MAITSALFAISPSAAETAIIEGPYAFLDKGQKGPYEWRVFTSPMNRSRMRSLPCINVSIEPELRPISEAGVFMLCGTVKPFPIVTQVAAGRGNEKVTVAGMAFDQEVRMVHIPLSDGKTVRRRPRVISAQTARKAHVKPFAFLAFAVARGITIGRVTGYDASGRPISGHPSR